MSTREIDVIRSADLIVRRLLAVKPGEQVAIVCDPHTEMRMAHAIAGITESVGAEYTILVQPTRTTHRKNELTPPIVRALEAADCLVGMTGSGGAPTYSGAVRRLFDEERLRAISMVMRTLENFTEGGARADYDALHADGTRLAAIWAEANQIRVTTPAGTDLTAPIAGERVFIECGFASEPGEEAAFSDGEVSQMPRVGCAEGTLVIDGPIAHIGVPDEPIVIRVSEGRVTRIEGSSPQANELRGIVESVPHADNIAEIGIGLNPACRRNGDFEEEKKARGLVHVAIGDNVFYGGEVACGVHMDMVQYAPTVWLDDRRVVEAGEVLID